MEEMMDFRLHHNPPVMDRFSVKLHQVILSSQNTPFSDFVLIHGLLYGSSYNILTAKTFKVHS